MFNGLDLLGADALDDVRSGTVLKRGSKGEAVKAVQGLLAVVADGDFGAKTETAVKAFQGSRGLMVDGKVGKETLAALENSPSVTHVDFTEDEVITASAPKAATTLQQPAAAKATSSIPAVSASTPAVAAADETKKNTYIAVGLGVLGSVGIALAWNR